MSNEDQNKLNIQKKINRAEVEYQNLVRDTQKLLQNNTKAIEKEFGFKKNLDNMQEQINKKLQDADNLASFGDSHGFKKFQMYLSDNISCSSS